MTPTPKSDVAPKQDARVGTKQLDQFEFGGDRHINLKDALAEARRAVPPTGEA